MGRGANGRAVAVAVFALRVASRSSRRVWCCGCGLCAARGVAVAVFALRVVSRSRSSRRVRCRGRGLCAVWCCGCRRRAVCGAAGAVVAPRVVLRVPSSHRVGVAVTVVAPRGCRGCRRRAWVSRSRSLRRVGVAIAGVVPRVVSPSPSLALCRVWCRRRRRGICAACGVAVAVFAPRGCCGRGLCAACGVAVAVVAPRVVSRVPSLRRVWYRGRRRRTAWVSRPRSSRRGVLRWWWLSSCRVVPQLPSSTRRVRVQGNGEMGVCRRRHGR